MQIQTKYICKKTGHSYFRDDDDDDEDDNVGDDWWISAVLIILSSYIVESFLVMPICDKLEISTRILVLIKIIIVAFKQKWAASRVHSRQMIMT